MILHFSLHYCLKKLRVRYQALMHANGLQKYFVTMQTPNTLENRNAIRCTLKIFPRIFQSKINREIREFSLRWKNNILMSSKVMTGQTRLIGSWHGE